LGKPELTREMGAAIARMVEQGHVAPIVGQRFPLEQAAEALRTIEERRATGKVVLDVRSA
jgi:NADPH2:quinone reductase